MASTEEFGRVIAGILSPDNNIRKQAEEYFNQTKQQQPDYCVTALMQLVRSSSEIEVRSLSCVLLRKCISRTDEGVFGKLSQDVQSMVHRELMQAVLDETVESIRHKLVYALSGFVGGLSVETDISDFVRTVLGWAQSPKPEHRESAFGIFNQLSTHVADKGLKPYVPALHEALTAGLNDPQSGKVRLAAVEAAVSIVLTLSKAGRQQLQPLVPHMLGALSKSLNEGDTDSAATMIESLIEIAMTHSAYFKQHSTAVISAMFQISKTKELDESVRHVAMEFILSFTESSPSLVKKIPNFVENLFPLCMELMLTIDDDLEEWAATFDDDDSDLMDYDVGLEALDRVALMLGGKVVQPVAFNLIPQFLNSADWKHRHAGLMAIAQTAEGCAEEYEDHLNDLVSFPIRLFRDEHPRVRYAAIHCTAQLCTDFSGIIQKSFHNQIVPALLNAMSDGVAKVQAHAATAVVNYSEDCSPEFITPYMDSLLSKLLELLKGGQRYMQEQALSAISAIADCAEKHFVKYYDHIMPFLKEILLKATDKQDRTLRGRAIECVSLIGVAVGKEKFGPDAKAVMDLLMHAQLNLESDDSQAYHIFQAWSRIARCLGDDFISYLPLVMPPLLKSASRDPDVIVTDVDDDSVEEEEGMDSVTLNIQGVGEKRVSIRTSVLEEKSMACGMLYNYAATLKSGFFPHVQETASIVVPLLKFAYLDEIREIAAAIMPELLGCVKAAVEKGQANVHMVKQLMDFIWKTLLEALSIEPEVSTAVSLIESASECIEVVGSGFLEAAHVEQITTQIKDLVIQSITRRDELKKAHEDEYEDEEEQAYLEEELLQEEDLVTSLGELVGNLFKHEPQFLPFFTQYLYAIFAAMLDQQRPKDDNRIALCVMCDFIEHGKGAANQVMTSILPALINYALDENPDVRQAALYGLGAASQFGNDAVNAAAVQIAQRLVAAIQSSNAKDPVYAAATCNAVSSLYKVAQFRGNVSGINAAELLSIWMGALPTSGDTIEARIVHGHFVDLVQQNNPVVMGQNFANIPLVLRILANISKTELVTDETQAKIAETLRQMQSSLPGPMLSEALGNLTDRERQVLQETLQ